MEMLKRFLKSKQRSKAWEKKLYAMWCKRHFILYLTVLSWILNQQQRTLTEHILHSHNKAPVAKCRFLCRPHFATRTQWIQTPLRLVDEDTAISDAVEVFVFDWFILLLEGGGARRSDPCWDRGPEEAGSQADVRRAGTPLSGLESQAETGTSACDRRISRLWTVPPKFWTFLCSQLIFRPRPPV